MRVLGIETSGQQGSVALVEADRVVVCLSHDAPNRHAEETLPLVERALAEAGWNKRDLDRVAAARGPGSFTGVRVGLALASGMHLGLGVEACGVGSLLAAAVTSRVDAAGHLALPTPGEWLVVKRDARREEHFLAIYDAQFDEIISPRAVATAELDAHIAALCSGRDHRLVEVEPDARGVALYAATHAADPRSLGPQYVRDAGATPQVLLPSPLLGERR